MKFTGIFVVIIVSVPYKSCAASRSVFSEALSDRIVSILLNVAILQVGSSWRHELILSNHTYAILKEDGVSIQPHLPIGVLKRCTRDELAQLVLGPAATTAGGHWLEKFLALLPLGIHASCGWRNSFGHALDAALGTHEAKTPAFPGME